MLRDGGYFIIEDIETSYWDKPQAKVYGYPLPNVGTGRVGSVIEAFKLLVEVINHLLHLLSISLLTSYLPRWTLA